MMIPRGDPGLSWAAHACYVGRCTLEERISNSAEAAKAALHEKRAVKLMIMKRRGRMDTSLLLLRQKGTANWTKYASNGRVGNA